MPSEEKSDGSILARRAFGTACGFLVVVAGLGTLLRWQMVRPVGGVNYA